MDTSTDLGDHKQPIARIETQMHVVRQKSFRAPI